MITDRLLELQDLNLLQLSLADDIYHQGTTVDFFTAPGSVCKVYEDEDGPICFVRGSKALRMDIQYMDNTDVRRNMKCMLQGFPPLVDKARENGFTEIIFNSDHDLLREFCVRRLGFVPSGDELRKEI